MIKVGLPDQSQVVDQQFVQIAGPNGCVKGFQYDKETNTFIQKENQVIIPSSHGITHVSDDAIPTATPDLKGLLSAADKAKLDALTQSRLGVLGFMGAGFPDDGGWMQGDIILSAGSEFISLERVGNIIRFTVDSPVPLNCGCEECAQIYWIQDESDVRNVRPPSCNGVMPGVNSYGEFKVYMYPENAIFNPNKATEFFAKKNGYPTFQFTRYLNSGGQLAANMNVVLKRNSNQTTNVGWAMTPGPSNVAQCVWFMGNDSEGRQIQFELLPESEPGLLGALLYQGNTLTRQMAVVVGYTSTILSTNQYNVKKWDVLNAKTVGDKFVATNIWQYDDPENSIAVTPPSIVTDKTEQLLPVGSLVELWAFELSNVNGTRTFKSYFRQRPHVSATNLWSLNGAIRFGDLFEQRDDINHNIGVIGTGTELTASVADVSDIRIYERTLWGITNFDDFLLISDDGEFNSTSSTYGTYEPSGIPVNNGIYAKIDYALPGLIITKVEPNLIGDINHDGVVSDADLAILTAAYGTSVGDSAYNADADLNKDDKVDVRDLGLFGLSYHISAKRTSDRPVFIWHRQNHKNFIFRAKVGRPDSSDYPPIDLLFNAPIDHIDDIYLKVIERGIYGAGIYANLPYIVIQNNDWKDLPPNGALRILTGVYRDIVWKYSAKIFNGDRTVLIGTDTVFPFDDDYIEATATVDTPTNTTVAELLHADYSCTAARFEFSINETSSAESVQLQLNVGTLSMDTAYELDKQTVDNTAVSYDDFVRGFLPGQFATSAVLTQIGFITDGVGSDVESTPEDFKVYDGGTLDVPVGSETEKWNDLILMVKNGQVWIWWNGMLVPPDPSESAKLPTPVAVNTPYWPITTLPVGKVGLRVWPGTKIRDVEVYDQNTHFNEYMFGQLEIN